MVREERRLGHFRQVAQHRILRRTRVIKRGERIAGLSLFNSAFQNLTCQFQLDNVADYPQGTFARFLDSLGPELTRSIRILFEKAGVYLIQVLIVAKYQRENLGEPPNSPKRHQNTVGWHDSLMEYVSSAKHFEDDVWPVMQTKINENYEQFVNNGSNWIYDGIDRVFVNVYEYNPHGSGRRKLSNVHPLPPKLQNSHCVISVNNTDNECFRYAILSRLAYGFPSVRKRPQAPHVYNRKEISTLADFSSCTYPVDIAQIDRFEELNPELAINVYTYVGETDAVRKCRTSMRTDTDDGVTEINLLLFEEHFMWISHKTRLLNSRAVVHHGLIMCPSCELHFTSQQSLRKHSRFCRHQEGFSIQPRITMPRVGEESLRFTEYTKTQFVPVVIYADFESILPRTENEIPGEADAPHEISMTRHVPCGFGVKLVCILDDTKTRATEIYRSEDGKDHIIDVFLEKLNEYEADVTEWLANPKAMLPLTVDEQTKYDTSTDLFAL